MAFNKYPKITTTYIEDELYESVNGNGNKTLIDMRGPEQKQSLAPMEVLLGAVASCSAVDLVEILKKRKKTFSSLTVTTEGERRDDHPRAFTKIKLQFSLISDNITHEELYKNAKLVVDKYCSVATTVSGVAELEVEVEVVGEE